jgi:hypothetical protein
MNFTLLVLLFAFSSCFKAQNSTIFASDNLQKFIVAIKPLVSGDPFTEIVTLGSLCLSKCRTKSFLSDYKPENLRNGNYLFDWMFILNYSSLAIAIRNNLTGVFDRQSLRVIPQGLYNPKYGFMFNHVFDHIKDFKLNPQSYNRTYDSIHDKYVYLTRQSLASFRMTQKTLYISYVYTLKHRQSDFINLVKSIRDQRGNSNFLVLVLVIRDLMPNRFVFDTLIEGNLCFHEIEYYRLAEWGSEKSKTQWNRILNEFVSSN